MLDHSRTTRWISGALLVALTGALLVRSNWNAWGFGPQGQPAEVEAAPEAGQTGDVAQPPAEPPVEAAMQPARLEAYRLPPAQLQVSLDRVQKRFADTPGVRLTLDRRGSQLLVLAPEAVHQQLQTMLPIIIKEAGADEVPVARRQPPKPAVDRGPRESTTMALEHIGPREFEDALARLWRGRLPLRVAPGGERAALSFDDAAGDSVTLEIDRAGRRVTIDATRAGIEEWRRVVASLDRRPATPDEQTGLVGFGNAERGKIELAVAAFQPEQPQGREGAAPVPGQVPPAGQPGEGPAGGEPAIGLIPPGGGEGGEIGPVRIEFLEGLDVIVVRGNKRDVARVVKIINDIERLSAETQPAIEILPLRHIDSAAVVELVAPLYEEVLQPRQGRVSITALVKPNALLLIGREDSVASVVDLVRRLDEPVPPATQFRVFRLMHLAAIEAQETVSAFYEERGGLGVRVRVLADFRSNSLIVRGSPRDLIEVERLLDDIDVLESAAVNEVRVFPLQNSLAEELGPVLQEAVRGGGVDVAGDVGTGQQPGQPGAGTQRGGEPRSAMLTLSTLDAEGKRLLRSGILTDVRIVADPRANALIVTSPPENMELIAALIERIDTLPAAEAQIKVFTIINGDATALAEMLQNLFGQSQTGGQQGLPALGAGGESNLVPLRFSIDQRTNSIITSGSSADLAVVEALLLRLDESDVDQRKSEVYRLQNAPAIDVAVAINEFLRSERQVQQLAVAGVSPFEQIEREVIVVPEPVNNSLIISATPRYFNEIMDLVRDLDKRPPMVLIQVLIAQVQLNDIDELGVELGIQESLLFDRSVVTDTVDPGFDFNGQPLGNSSSPASLATRDRIGTQGFSNFGLGRASGTLGYGGLVLSASSDAVSVLIRALQEDRRLDVLSRPQVMTLDNQPAFVQIGARVPRITSTQLTEQGTINNTVLENVGILLGVTPRISPDGLIVMEIDAENSELGPEAEGIPISINSNGDVIRSPQIKTTTAQTTVSARTGQTVILGGLISKSRNTVSRRVPILGDIPIIGSAFRYDSTDESRQELLLIMTPYVVYNESDIEAINQQESQRMSWCLADVVEIHGDVGMSASEHYKRLPNQKFWPWRDHVFKERRREPVVIYPDMDPTASGFADRTGRGGMPAVWEDQGHLLLGRPPQADTAPYYDRPRVYYDSRVRTMTGGMPHHFHDEVIEGDIIEGDTWHNEIIEGDIREGEAPAEPQQFRGEAPTEPWPAQDAAPAAPRMIPQEPSSMSFRDPSPSANPLRADGYQVGPRYATPAAHTAPRGSSHERPSHIRPADYRQPVNEQYQPAGASPRFR